MVPCGETPTTEGMIRSSPWGRIRGTPSRTCAAAEKVVPRSIPIIMLMMSSWAYALGPYDACDASRSVSAATATSA